MRHLLAVLLEPVCDELLVAANGQEALRFLASGRVSLLVTDIFMSAPNGLDVVSAAKQLDNPPLILVVSGGGADGHMEELVAEVKDQVDEYLQKPFTPAQLVGRVNSLLLRDKVGGFNESARFR